MYVFAPSYDEIFKQVTEEDVYYTYLGYMPELGVNYNSPLRDNDPTPSFGVYVKGGHLKWKDFGEDHRCGNNVVGFVRKLFGVEFKEALQRIYLDVVCKEYKAPVKLERKKRITRAGVAFSQKWSKEEFDFWKELGSSREILRKYEIFPCHGAFFNGYEVAYSRQGDPMYVYVFDLKKNSWKTYRPWAINKCDKFRTHNVTGVIEGWNQLPQSGRELHVMSALKDTVVMANVHENACNPPGEGILYPLLNRYEELSARFSEIFVIFDNDRTGIKNAKKLEAYSNWRWKPLIIPPWLPKDPPEIVQQYNLYTWKEVLRSLKN